MKEISEMIFDKVILQIDWNNPRCMDKTGELIAITWETIDWDARTWNFEFKNYKSIKGALTFNRLWITTTKFSDEYSSYLFRYQSIKDKAFRIITVLCKPLNHKRIGYRLILYSHIITFIIINNHYINNLFNELYGGDLKWKR